MKFLGKLRKFQIFLTFERKLINEQSLITPYRYDFFGKINKRTCSSIRNSIVILNFSEMVRDIHTTFSPVVQLFRNPFCIKFEGSRCLKFGFPAKIF